MEKFHERFNIHVPVEEARKRFVNRIHNEVLGRYFDDLPDNLRHDVKVTALTLLGIRHDYSDSLARYLGEDFWTNVRGVEALFNTLKSDGNYSRALGQIIQNILFLSEVDLGIRWHEGRFLPSGSPILDERLVNDATSPPY